VTIGPSEDFGSGVRGVDTHVRIRHRRSSKWCIPPSSIFIQPSALGEHRKKRNPT